MQHMAKETDQHQSQNAIKRAFVGIALLMLSIATGMAIGGEVGQFMTASIEVVPFLVLAVLTYITNGKMWVKVLTLAWLALVLAGFAGFTIMWSIVALLEPASVQSMVAETNGSASASPSPPQFLPGSGNTLLITIVLLGVAGLAGLPGFLPGVRRWLGRFIPLNPDSFVHMAALVTIVSVSLMACVPLVTLGNPPVLSDNALLLFTESGGQDAATVNFQAYTMIWMIIGSLLCVGLGVRRTLRETLLRLGVVRPTIKHIIIGIALAPVLVLAAEWLGDGINWLWLKMGWTVTNEQALEIVFGTALTPVGALVAAVSAGVGEELAVRGVLQPRMGIVLSNLFFASMHALQYNWDGFLVVFLLGAVFAVLRQRTNTTTCAITHGLYDLILFAMLL